jgi:nitrate/nitrite-specific signal transduction histidine kinase
MAKSHLRRHLAVKITAWSFVPTVIILSAVAWFTFYSYEKVIGDLAIKQDQEIVREKGGQVIDALNGMLEPILLPIFLEIDIFHNESLEVRAEKILNYTRDLDVFDGGIYFLDGDGKIFKMHPAQPELLGQDWSETPSFRYLQEHNNMSVPTDLFYVPSSGKKIVCTAIAMIGEARETVGATYFCYTIYPAAQNTFYKILNSVNLSPNIYILDSNQNVIYSPDVSEMGMDWSGESYLQQLLEDDDQSGRFRIGTEDMVVSYFSVMDIGDSIGWIVLKKQSWNEFMQPSRGYRQFLLVLLALGVLVPLLVTVYGVRHITEPIHKLIEVSAQVTEGQFKNRIEVQTGDEIETLADQFNLMSAKLVASYSLLEKKVADRTQELAILNSIISVASHSLDIHEILEDALSNTVEQMGFDVGAAFRVEDEPASTVMMAYRGMEQTAALDLLNIRLIIDRDQTANELNEVIAIEVENLQDGRIKQSGTQLGLQRFVYVPFSTKGHELGFFILGKRESGHLSSEELSLLSSIGKQVGVSMENARLYQQAEQAAIAAERNRLARELHDAVTQTLFSANLIADVTPRIWKRSPVEGMQNLEELRQLTRGALAEMRTMLLEMRPESLERADIKSLLTQLADAFIGRVRVPLTLKIIGDCDLTHDVKLVYYRVAQEALNNIAKHSGARQVDVRLECQPSQLLLCVKDDGLGFEPDSLPAGHMGIAIMRERASSIGACLKIDSQPGRGTTVELDWRPLWKDGTDESLSEDSGNGSGRS